LDGPVLGNLPLETKETIRQIEAQGVQRRQAYFAARQAEGKASDARDLARLRQETRAQLAKVLSSAQLEEYLLRYSHNAEQLRDETRGLGISPDEFRKIFRARDEIHQQIQLHFAGDDGASANARRELERKREEAVQEAIGTERYAFYRHIQDPLFRQAQAVAEEAGAKPESVLHIYAVNQATEEERRRLRNDPSLSTEQRTAALARMVLEKEEALRKILGTEAYEQYHAASRDELEAIR
jgi:putative cell wall-binding protein